MCDDVSAVCDVVARQPGYTTVGCLTAVLYMLEAQLMTGTVANLDAS